jgi:hypothetical protein
MQIYIHLYYVASFIVHNVLELVVLLCRTRADYVCTARCDLTNHSSNVNLPGGLIQCCNYIISN